MSYLSFMLFAEIGISVMLFFFGYTGIFGGLISTFSGAVGVDVPNVTDTNQTGNLQGDPTVFSENSLKSSSNGYMFNIFTILLGTGAVLGVLSLFGMSSFSSIYIIPAMMVMLLMFALLSPIISIINMVIIDPLFAPLGWMLWLFFLGINVWGCISFIRGTD